MTRARRHLLTGDPLDADTALRLGVVTDLVDSAEGRRTPPRPRSPAGWRDSPLAVQGTKRALNQVSRQRADEVVDLALAFEEQTLASEDLSKASRPSGAPRSAVLRALTGQIEAGPGRVRARAAAPRSPHDLEPA